MKRPNQRYVALITLQRLFKTMTPLPVLFQGMCEKHQLSGADRGLAMSLVYGVLRQREYLELLIKKLCRLPLKKLDPMVKLGLEIGLYQIFFLDRIPDSASVNETVKAIKLTPVPKRLHGFVNGVLRESVRQRNNLPQPDDLLPENTPVLNHPGWLTSRWEKHFGKTTMIEICRYNNTQQPLVLRLSTRIDRDLFLKTLGEKNIEAAKGKYAPKSILLPFYQGKIHTIPGYGDNLFTVQGESAQLASLLLAPIVKNGHYLDGCAGLGTKTSHIMEMITPYKGTLTAIEPEERRMNTLQKEFSIGNTSKNEAAGMTNLTFYHGQLQSFSVKNGEKFDGILVDAPCSGTGIIGKQPDIRWRRSADDILSSAKKQLELLQKAAQLLKQDGVLVYATCSIEPEENQKVIATFLEHFPDFKLTDPASVLPEACTSLIKNSCLQPLPSDGVEGFFAARLVRTP